MSRLTSARIGNYIVLWIFAAILLGLTAARIRDTKAARGPLPPTDRTHYYEPIIAELLVTACLALLWVPAMVIAMSSRGGSGFRFNMADLIGIFILFVMSLVGAAIVTHFYNHLSYCWYQKSCKLLTAIVAFSWVFWAWTFFLLMMAVIAFFLKHNDDTGYRRGARSSSSTGSGARTYDAGRTYETRSADAQPITTGAAPPVVTSTA